MQCNICGSYNSTFLFNNHDRLHGVLGTFKINQCENCNLVFVCPQPENMEKFYKNKYEPYNFSKNNFFQKLDARLMEAYFGEAESVIKKVQSQIYKLLYSPIPRECKGQRILDIGCSNGIFLYNLKKFGKFDVYGVEMSEYAVKQAKEKLGLINVVSGKIENTAFRDSFFDIITLNHVIEHLPDPKKTLVEIKRILKRDGLLVITTPNANSLNFKIFKQFWFALETPRHLNIFSEKTFRKIIGSVGDLKIERISYNISNFVFAKSLIHFFRIKNSFLVDFLMKIKIIFYPIFYLLPKNKRDFCTIYIKKYI